MAGNRGGMVETMRLSFLERLANTADPPEADGIADAVMKRIAADGDGVAEPIVDDPRAKTAARFRATILKTA